MKLNRNYLFLAFLIFTIEVLIALYVHDRIIRPYIGDTLVVILMYCTLKAFFELSVWKAAISVLAFSFFIEMLQYFRIVELLGLSHNKLASTIIGTSFAWQDLVAYLLGFVLILGVEKAIKR